MKRLSTLLRKGSEKMKYTILKSFRDKYTKELYEKGQEIDLLVKRAKEIEKNLGSGFIQKKDQAVEPMEQLLKDFKSRMRIFHNADDDNLENILESSTAAIKRWCGSEDITKPEIRELIIERSRYVYNDSLEFFNENFLSELMAVSLSNYVEEDVSDEETNV